jgi:hypothetical protein
MAKMKRLVLLILVFLLMVDLAEDGCLGKAPPYLPCPTAKTSATSSHNHPGSGQTDFRYEPTSTDLSGSPRYVIGQPTTLLVPHILKIIHYSHLGGAGAIPL